MALVTLVQAQDVLLRVKFFACTELLPLVQLQANEVFEALKHWQTWADEFFSQVRVLFVVFPVLFVDP